MLAYLCRSHFQIFHRPCSDLPIIQFPQASKTISSWPLPAPHCYHLLLPTGIPRASDFRGLLPRQAILMGMVLWKYLEPSYLWRCSLALNPKIEGSICFALPSSLGLRQRTTLLSFLTSEFYRREPSTSLFIHGHSETLRVHIKCFHELVSLPSSWLKIKRVF